MSAIGRVLVSIPGMLPRLADTPSLLVVTAPDITRPASATPIVHTPSPVHASALLAAAIYIIRREFGDAAIRGAFEIERSIQVEQILK